MQKSFLLTKIYLPLFLLIAGLIVFTGAFIYSSREKRSSSADTAGSGVFEATENTADEVLGSQNSLSVTPAVSVINSPTGKKIKPTVVVTATLTPTAPLPSPTPTRVPSNTVTLTPAVSLSLSATPSVTPTTAPSPELSPTATPTP